MDNEHDNGSADELQRDLQTLSGDGAPSAELPASGRTPHATLPGRFSDGTLAPGFPHNVRTGLRSRLLREGVGPDGADLRQHLRERADAIVADLGGDVGNIKQEMIGRFVELTAVADHLMENIIDNGVLTSKGRGRAAASAYLHVVDRLQKLAMTIGMDRKPKEMSFMERLLAAKAENDRIIAAEQDDNK